MTEQLQTQEDQNKMANKKVDALVVGAGPTGLTLACELARHGVSFRIIDKLSVASDKSKALAVHSRSLEVLEDMGIVERFLAFGLKVRGVNIFADSKQIADLSLDELDGHYSFALTLPQTDTERLLMEHLDQHGHCVERGFELVDIRQDENGVESTVRTAAGAEEVIKSRWVVGCDGAHSAVRKLNNMDFVGTKYPDFFYLSDVKVDGAVNYNEIYVFNTESGLLALFPYGGNRYRLAATMPSQEEDPTKAGIEPSIEEFQAIADERSTFSLQLSEQLWSTGIYIHRRHVNHYREGNCFVAGDAAHIHSPAGGQGMNTGIQDAYNLAWKMALVAKDLSSDKLLDTYNDERLGIALGVLRLTDFMMRVNTLKNPVAKHLRNTLAPVLTAQEVIQKRIKHDIAELSLNYRKSPIVEEHSTSALKAIPHKKDMPTLADIFEFTRGPGAGDRAPDGYISVRNYPVRLYEMLWGTTHTLLVFSGDETSDDEMKQFQNIASGITQSHRDLVKAIFIVDSEESVKKCAPHLESFKDQVQLVADWEMSIHHRYSAGANCMYLIRPDKYIGFRSQPMDLNLLTAHLNRIFDRALLQIT